jgi:hypothetical protein
MRIGRRFIDPSLSQARSCEIFSRPGQSSCFRNQHDAVSVAMRRMTPGVICTEKVSG